MPFWPPADEQAAGLADQVEWATQTELAEVLTHYLLPRRRPGAVATATRGPVSVLQVPGLANPLPGADPQNG